LVLLLFMVVCLQFLIVVLRIFCLTCAGANQCRLLVHRRRVLQRHENR
jgi:hypothetical protein